MSDISESDESIETQTDIFNFYNDLVLQVFSIDFENEEFVKQVKFSKFYTFNENVEYPVWNSEINYDDDVIRCSYLLKFSVINTYCVLKHFQDVFDCLANPLKDMNTARICCFGGGGGVELFAICKVIYDFLRCNSNEEDHYAIKLYFTVIDVCSEWESWCVFLVKQLRKSYKDVIDLRMRFVQADLTNKWGEDVLKAVQKADILTMVKFLSALNLKNLSEHKTDFRMLKNVALEMKLNSWIFFLDFAGGSFYKKMQSKMKKYQYFEQFQEFLHQTHSLNKKKWDISEPLSSPMYYIMHRNSAVSSGTWLKCPKKPNSVKKTPIAQNVASASNTLDEQTDEDLLLKEVGKVKELDYNYEVPGRLEVSDSTREIEAKNETKVKGLLKKSRKYKAKIKNSGRWQRNC